MKFNEAVIYIKNGKSVTRKNNPKIKTPYYLILGLSNGKPKLEIAVYYPIGSVISEVPQIFEYKFTWEDIISEDWEIYGE